MPKAIVMAGGTGGHIFPALAVADALREKAWDIHWLGTADRMEADIVPANNFPIHFLPVKGLRGKGVLSKLLAVVGLLKSVLNAWGLVNRFQPDVVIGFGGYPSGPGGVAAKIKGIPLFIHEQNAVPGLTNKLLANIAKGVFVAFPNAQKVFADKNIPANLVGNPVRKDIVRKHYQARTHSEFRLLVIGGSLGAKVLNDSLPAICAQFNTVNVLHQCGKGNAEYVKEAYQRANVNAEVVEFIHDINPSYEWADAIVCRAGALTVSEVAQAGLAACFVPLPHAVDDHQTKNAQVLANVGAAFIVAQPNLQEQLPGYIAQWVDEQGLCEKMGELASQILPNNATQHIVELLVENMGRAQ